MSKTIRGILRIVDKKAPDRKSRDEVISRAGSYVATVDAKGEKIVSWVPSTPGATVDAVASEITGLIEAQAWFKDREETLRESAIRLKDDQKRVADALTLRYQAMGKLSK